MYLYLSKEILGFKELQVQIKLLILNFKESDQVPVGLAHLGFRIAKT